MRAGAGPGRRAADRVALPAAVLAEPEPDRAAVEVREEGSPDLPVPRGLHAVQGGDRRMPGAGRGQAQGGDRLTPDAQVPDLREPSTPGRVEYSRPGRS